MFFVEVETSDGPQYRRAAWDDIVIPAGHSFGDPEWDWDNSESNEAVATATFTCEECGEEQEETVTAVKISSTGEPGADVLVKEVWQASVGTCTDTLTRYWLPTNHAYSLPEWTWNADGGDIDHYCMPTGITLDSDGSIWVVDTEHSRVNKFILP